MSVLVLLVICSSMATIIVISACMVGQSDYDT